MNRKRHSTSKSKSRKRKSYAQKHPRANSVGSSPQDVENERYRMIFIIMLIIAIVALLLYLIQGGVPGYDWYPGRALYDR